MIVVELKEDQPTLACYVDIIGRRSYLRTSNIQTSFYGGQTQQLPQHGKEERHTLLKGRRALSLRAVLLRLPPVCVPYVRAYA